MRKMPLFWLGLAALAGVTLFHTAQEVQDKRQKLAYLQNELAKEKESIRVLQAEWSYLNQPMRLEELITEYLPELSPLTGKDFTTLDKIPLRPAPLPLDKKTETPLLSQQQTQPEKYTPSAQPKTVNVSAPVITPIPKPAPQLKQKAQPKPVYIRETPQKIIPEQLEKKQTTSAISPSIEEAKATKDFGDVMKSLGVQ